MGKRSEAAIAAANHWKRAKGNPAGLSNDADAGVSSSIEKTESLAAKEPMDAPVIVITDSEEENALPDTDIEEPLQTTPVSNSTGVLPSPFELIETPSIGTSGTTIESFIGLPDLKSTYQFNFSIDVEFFLQHIHKDASPEITFITGTPGLTDGIQTRLQLRSIVAPLFNRFGTHHTKMMINFFEDSTVEVIVMTANLTLLDFGGLTQMCWRSGRLSLKGQVEKENNRSTFQKDLISYLRHYKLDRINMMAQNLRMYDFSEINVELFASVPGKFSIDRLRKNPNIEAYGYGRLLQLLHKYNLFVTNTEIKTNILAQASSIAAPFRSAGGRTCSIFSHIICPMAFTTLDGFSPLSPGRQPCIANQSLYHYEPYVVYPSAQNMSRCAVGWAGGSACHFRYSGTTPAVNQYLENIKPYLSSWKCKGNRGAAPPHIKMYLCDNGDQWKSLKWAIMCSHNLSKQAWGSPQASDNDTYTIASYELGIFIGSSDRKLLPVYDKMNGVSTEIHENTRMVTIPFELPPSKYLTGDLPWSSLESFPKLRDINNMAYIAEK